jgi:molecular chaperone HscB
MARKSIPVRSESMLECRNCGAGAPVDEHFCPECSRIVALGRHGDYFSFLGLPRQLIIEPADLERRYRDLSRRFHPDFFYNAPPAERLASLERTSYLNDAYRVLKSVPARVEYLLSLEGLDPIDAAGSRVPPALLEEVFALNEELDEIRESREAGAGAADLRARLEIARGPIELKREAHERQLGELSARWDASDQLSAEERRSILDALRQQLLERNYINNLLATIEREVSALDGQEGASAAAVAGADRESRL